MRWSNDLKEVDHTFTYSLGLETSVLNLCETRHRFLGFDLWSYCGGWGYVGVWWVCACAVGVVGFAVAAPHAAG